MREIPAAAQDELARVMSLPERTIRRWVAQMKREGGTAIEPKRRGRKAGEAAALNARRMKRIESIVLGKMSDQLRLPFNLWTQEAVGALIEREYGIALSAASIGNYRKRWRMSPQKPVRRAYERDDAAIQRFGCSMISAVSNRGALAFRVFEGRFHAETFIDFMQRLRKHGQGRKVALIVDGHPVHKSNAGKRRVADQAGAVTLHFLPGYAPELNLDELLNHDLKLGLTKRRRIMRSGLAIQHSKLKGPSTNI